MMKHSNISIFVPHFGCKNMCSFCNQLHITGERQKPSAKTVIDAVNVAMESPRFNSENAEIAFFGGSFTAIDRDYQNELLSAAFQFVKSGAVKGIRISTRPDAIDEEILENLKSFGVTSIELGAQSMDDEVLKLNLRGHNSDAVYEASRLIKDYGFSLGLQMMTGLYGDTDEKSFRTAVKIAEIKPQTVRIYPTIVLKNTYLEKLFNEGKYKPQSISEASSLCGKLLDFFQKEEINVIRLGLHSIEEDSFVAGPWHPAFGEMCESARYLNLAYKILENQPKGIYNLIVKTSEISKMVGQHKSNIEKLKEKGYVCSVSGDSQMDKLKIIIKSR